MRINFTTLLFPFCGSKFSKNHIWPGLFALFIFVFVPGLQVATAQPIVSQKASVATRPASNCKDIEPEMQIRKAAMQTLKNSTNNIWFEKNDGQFGNSGVLYGFRTSFGSMGVFNNKLRLVTEQTENGKKLGQQIVDIRFPGSQQQWSIETGTDAAVKGTYNTQKGPINAAIYNEITLKNVYDGIDLRLYSGENGALEFDWLVARAADHRKIRMNFTGQDDIRFEKNGDIVIGLKHEDMKIMIPETYQVINGSKKLFAARMCPIADKNTLQYKIAGGLEPNLPLVIDPVMIWSTFVHNNTSTFDEYLYTIAVNATSEVYACGVTNQAISTPYMSNVAPGFLGVYTFGLNAKNEEQSVILYRLNPMGTAITAWTYTGQRANIPVAMGIFPDNRILVVYQKDTIQIFSADLTTRHYNNVISTGVGNNVLSYQSQAIISNDVFYLGGVAESALPASIIPATAPDTAIAGKEGVILRVITASTTPTAEWGTYVGGTADESFTAIAVTPDKSKIAFGVHVDGLGVDYPALVNEVDNTIGGTELLVGVIPVGKPTAFDVFSYLGGSSDEGNSASKSASALVAADNKYFYVAGNTISKSLPGTAGAAQSSHAANSTRSDQFLSQIPLNGSTGVGFITTYNGGEEIDLVGGLVIDHRTNYVLLFGSTESLNFPVFNASAYSPYYQPVHGSTASGKLDITYTVFANGLASRKFSTFIGGDHNDYLGSTGKLQGTGHFQYNATNGLTYIGTTIHSDETSIPSPWMSDIPGFDKTIPTASTSKDNHFIFAMNPNTLDFGDAPATYEAGNPASSAVSFYQIRIGDEEDPEENPGSSATANGDDNQNYGSLDDEDGVFALPSIKLGDTTYSVTVSVFNNTGATVKLHGWIDTNGNGLFDINEYASVNVPSGASQQFPVLNFTHLPPFTTASGYTYLRLRFANVTLTAANATGEFGKGEVEDHLVLQTAFLLISLKAFTAVPRDDKALLNWTMSSEKNVLQYGIEHSSDNVKFDYLGTMGVKGKADYNWLHSTPVAGSNYYRLKITDVNGNITYSSVREINFGQNLDVTIYPNPTKGIIHISLPANMINKKGTIRLYSFDGLLLDTKNINTLSPLETMDIKAFQNGRYIIKIFTDETVIVRMVEVLKD